jgi:general secretion pathway protein K
MTRTMPPTPKPPTWARQRGLALIVVLWVAILLALLAGGVARLSRSDLNLARNLVEATKAELAADSALWTAVHIIVKGDPEAWRTDGTVYAWRFGEAEVRVRVTDELGRIDINAASPELLAALFVAAGTEPEEATGLADAVVEFRNQGLEDPEVPRTGRPSGDRVAAFALTDGLEQVPGMPPALQRRIADAITVYTGLAWPRSEVTSPLVLAATEGRMPTEPVDEPADEPAEGASLTATVEKPTLGGSPVVLDEPAEPASGFSDLIHIEAEALSDGGSYFAREAVIALESYEALPYRLRLWRRGTRVLFPAQEEAR